MDGYRLNETKKKVEVQYKLMNSFVQEYLL